MLAALLTIFPLASSTVLAGNSTWTGATNGSWNDETNWSDGVPGSTSGTDPSVATFNNNVNTTITYPGGNWVVSGITFTGPTVGEFEIGTTGGAFINLSTPAGGANKIETTADVVSPQKFTAPITFRGTSVYTFLSNATSSAATLTFNGNISMSSAAGLTLNGSNTGNNTIAGVIGGAGNLRKEGTGLWTLTNGSSSYTGATTIVGGVLSVSTLANGGVVSSIGASTNASSNLVLAGGTLKYTGGEQDTDRLFNLAVSVSTIDASGTGALNFTNTGAIGLHGQFGNRTLVLTGSNAGSLAASLGEQGGTTGITKTGNGTWILSGASTYSGNTAVNAGTLLVNNAVSGSDSGTGASSVIVSALGTLGGTGQITPGTDKNISVASGGKIAPGAGGIGTLTINAVNTSSSVLSMSSGAKFVFELNTGFESDKIVLLNGTSGDFVFGGNSIDFVDLSEGALDYGAYVLFSASAADNFGGAFATDDNGFIIGGLSIGTGLEAYAGSTLQLVGSDIVLNVVPEPSFVAFLTIAGTLLLVTRRRSRSQLNS